MQESPTLFSAQIFNPIDRVFTRKNPAIETPAGDSTNRPIPNPPFSASRIRGNDNRKECE